MKSMIVVALALVAVAVALPVKDTVSIIRSEFNQIPEGSYNYGYESEDGSKRDETGELKSVVDKDNKPQNVITVRGSYTYFNEDGSPVTITYEADEFGYRAFGDAIPKPARR